MNLNYPQRRVFRGRAGPTDRRLPKHNARRRRNHNHYSDEDRSGPPEIHDDNKINNETSDHEECDGSMSSCESLIILQSDDNEEEEGRPELVVRDDSDRGCGGTTVAVATPDNIPGRTSSTNGDAKSVPDDTQQPPPPYLVEIRHLKRRIRNVRELSIQTSRDAIASDLTKYRDNVLNATQNCVHEWRSIARHYDNDGNDDNDGLSATLRTEMGLDVFQLVQLSIQSGPLSGAKPGYFKRCGALVASAVLDFLERVVPRDEALGVECMGFSSRQLDTMNQWKRDAQKAVANDKPPSKSVLKKLQQQQRQQQRQQQQQQQQPKKAKKKKKK